MKRARACRLGISAAVLSITALIALAVGAASAVTVLAGNLVFEISGHTSPRALPSDHPAPAGFHGSASVATKDGSHIPAALGTEILVDRHIRLDTTGLKTCTLGQLEASTPSQAMAACGDALLGKGTSAAQVEFPESAPFDATGPLFAFNGPATGGGGYGGGGYNQQLYYVYANVPLPTALVAVGTVSKAGGRYGYKISISIPPIAGGAGSFEGAEFTINRRWTYRGRQHSFLNAECVSGHIYAQVEVSFRDGGGLKGKIVNPCQPLPG
jgi:hypothetical protein